MATMSSTASINTISRRPNLGEPFSPAGCLSESAWSMMRHSPVKKSRHKDSRACGLACFQIDMRLTDILEGIALIDFDLDATAGDHIEYHQQLLPAPRAWRHSGPATAASKTVNHAIPAH